MNITQLRYFVKICEVSSMTKAAKLFHVSQPSISSAIKNLEEELGVLLFNRTGRSLIPTLEGEILLHEATNIIQSINSLSENFQRLSNTRRLIRIGIPPMVGSFVFPIILVQFKTIYPEIKFEMFETGSLEAVELLRNNKLDLAIITGNQEVYHFLNTSLLLNTELLYCVGDKHPLHQQKSIRYSDIENDQIVFFPEGYYSHKLIWEIMEENGVRLNILLNSRQISTIKSFIKDNIGCSFLMPEVIDSNMIFPLRFEKKIPISIYVAWSKGIYLHSDIMKFIRFIHNAPLIP